MKGLGIIILTGLAVGLAVWSIVRYKQGKSIFPQVSGESIQAFTDLNTVQITGPQHAKNILGYQWNSLGN